MSMSITWNYLCGYWLSCKFEFFIRYNVSKEICDRVKYLGKSIKDASDQLISELKEIEADGGVIVLNKKGEAAMSFNTPAMARAYKGPIDELVEIYK